MKTIILFMSLVFSLFAFGASPNKSAPQGGVFNFNLDIEPETLHPIMAGDVPAQNIADYGHDTLCTTNPETYEPVPALAEKWEISKDGLIFTFTLRKNIFFHNGESITSDDVKFSLEAIREPKHQALNLLPYIETFKKIEVIDKQTIKFTASEKYFKNLEVLCSYFKIIPKSVYGDINKSIKLQKEFVGAGPYKLEKYDKGQLIVLKKFDKWYGKDVPYFKGYANFDQINFRFTKDDSILVEKLKKGDVDYAKFNSTDGYLKASKANLNKNAVAHKISNNMPKSYGFVGFNMKSEIFKDVNVRKAFYHLMNREEMAKKFKEGLADLATGPVYVKSNQAPDIKPVDFNPKKAQELLKSAGWADTDKNGILDKMIDGKKVELNVSIIYASKDSEKYHTMYKEDCKKAGIEINLKFLEWNSFTKAIDDRKMDLFAMGWGGGSVESDPKQIWHSSSGGKGGSNYGSYSNLEVDKLIDEARQELDSKKRSVMFKKAYTKIAEDVPYMFMFNNKYEFYANSMKVKKPADTFKYDFGYSTWWSASAK